MLLSVLFLIVNLPRVKNLKKKTKFLVTKGNTVCNINLFRYFKPKER